MLKIPCTLFILDASLLVGQKRHFQTVKTNDWAYIWCIFMVWKVYARSVIGLWRWPKFHFDFKPFKVSIFNRSTSRLKIQFSAWFLYFWIEKRINKLISQMVKWERFPLLLTNLLKMHDFPLFPGDASELLAVFRTFLIFERKKKAEELLNTIFENSSPKGYFW